MQHGMSLEGHLGGRGDHCEETRLEGDHDEKKVEKCFSKSLYRTQYRLFWDLNDVNCCDNFKEILNESEIQARVWISHQAYISFNYWLAKVPFNIYIFPRSLQSN